jgi:hypothetical protein
MMVYSNGKINVLANTRCGSTAIGIFLGLGLNHKRLDGIAEWWDLPGKKVIILRNPYDRVVSAYKTLIYLEENQKLDREPETFLAEHSGPYLHMIQPYNFSVILFETLSKYVPTFASHPTNTSNTPYGTYIKNSHYSAEDLENEYLLYETYRSEKEILDVESWNMLCERQ